jgi:putative nucleotidyltransferase with HDIG domain
LIGRNYWREYPEAANTPFAKAYIQAMESQLPITFEDYYEPWDRWFENRIYPTQDGLTIFFSDITERKLAENRIDHLTRLYATLSQINACIVRIKDRQELFEAVCRVAVDFGRFGLAWIGLTDLGSGNVEIVAHAGRGEQYLDEISANFREHGPRRGPTTEAIQESSVVVVNDVKKDARMVPWRRAVMNYGYRSLAAVPLREQGKVIGVLDLYAAEANFFTQDQLALLEELSQDLSFALDAMAAEAERQASQKRLETQIQRLSALRAIDSAITSGLDLNLFFESFIQHVLMHSSADAAAVYLLHRDMNDLELIIGRGFRGKHSDPAHKGIADTHAGKAVLERRLIHTPDLADVQLSVAESGLKSEEGFVCSCVVPLITKGQVKGVLEIYRRSPMHSDADWLDFILTLAGQAAIAIADVQMLRDLQRSNLELRFAYDETIEGWSRVLELRDQTTLGHAQRVAEVSCTLAARMGVAEVDLLPMRRGALLHDIGNMAIPDQILLKPGPLTEEEWQLIRTHPVQGYNMLLPVKFLRSALDIPYSHHEKWDGSGYPLGLAGEQIPFAARLFAVVDVYDALLSDRPYRRGWTKKKALEYIRSASGSHFDAGVVREFLKMIESKT